MRRSFRDIILDKNNGFNFRWLGVRLDDKSIKVLYPEYFSFTKDNSSPTYIKYIESNLSQKEFAKQYGYETVNKFNSAVQRELKEVDKKRDDELKRRFNIFIKEHREEIYKAQVKAIEQTEIETKKLVAEKEQEQRKKWEEENAQYLNGCNVAISTLKKEDNIDLINTLFKLGYVVKNASASMVFLELPQGKQITQEMLEQYFPFKFDNDYGRCFKRHVSPDRVCGVLVPQEWHLEGFEYPETELFPGFAW